MINLNIQLFGGRGSKSKIGTGDNGIGNAVTSKQLNNNKITKKELNNLMSVARQNEPSITKDLKEITHGLSGEIDYKLPNGKRALDYRLKTEESLERKINSDLREKSVFKSLGEFINVLRCMTP